ncbi:MAG: HD domain-containing protein [Pyrinomonadaceae bacterium]|nr:HD domain-containing protein [Pyrinomonadaceae bacterium]
MKNLQKLLHAASFAARKHSDQRRKGSNAEPYINHPLEVANLLADIGGIDDVDILSAAILHDTIEDTECTPSDITDKFGSRVAGLVLEVTDDKSLPKAERKRVQVEHSPHLSPDAKLIKLADKISNVRDVTNSPPAGWSLERRTEYIDWAEEVVAGLRGSNKPLEQEFDEVILLARKKL